MNRRVSLLVAAVLFAHAGMAQTVPTPLNYGDAVVQARQMALEHLAQHALPGLGVGVLVDGEIIYQEGFGWADLENRVPVWPDSKFRIGSVSKPITAAAVAKLVRDGLLDSDLPVQAYVPTFPEKRWTVTTRHLGGHLGGIRHYRGLEMLSNRPYRTVAEGLEIFAADSLLHEPGSAYRYSSYGWNLISAVVEGASGHAFLDEVRDRVFSPLNMQETTPEYMDSLIVRRVRYYERADGGGFVNSPHVDNSYKWAGGGFVSTTGDLLRFADAHMAGDYLSEVERSFLFTEQRTNSGEGVGYGFGWSVREDDLGPIVGHSGGSIGGTTQMLLDPHRRIAVVTFVNLSGANNSLGGHLLDLFREAVDAR